MGKKNYKLLKIGKKISKFAKKICKDQGACKGPTSLVLVNFVFLIFTIKTLFK